jgi:transketolase
MRAQFVKTVSKIIRDDPDAVLLLGDIGVFGFRHILSNYSDRAYNIGILEQSTISLAAGMSLNGLVPIVHTIAPFLVERALEQIKIDLCYQDLGANLVSVGASYDYAALGCTHHCPSDIPTLNEIPNIELIVPGHPNEFDVLFSENYNNGKASYFRLSEEKNDEAYNVEIGKNIVIQERGKIVIIAVGTILKPVLEASAGLDVTIIYCTTVKPFDFASIKNHLDKKIMIIEPYYSGPILTNISREVGDIKGYFSMLGVPNRFIDKYGTKNDIDRMIGLDPLSIRQKIIELIDV